MEPEKDNQDEKNRQWLGILFISDYFSPFGLTQQQSTKISENELLLFGGNSQRSYAMSSIYSLKDNSVNFKGIMNKQRVQHEVVTLQNGKVLIIGGYDGRFILADSEIYDPSTYSSVNISPMNVPRTYHTATLLNDGRVLITGGFGRNSEKLKSAEIFHPSTNTFELINDLNFSRRRHTATLLNNGKVILVGGDGANQTLSSAEIFDPTTNTFTALGQQMSVPRSNHTANLLDNNRVVLSCGYSFDTNGIYSYSNTAEVYDFTSGNFSVIGNMGEYRAGHSAVKINTDVILCGGGRFENNTYTETVDCFKISNSGTLSKETYQLQTSRVLFVFEQIGNNIIACGGENRFGQIRSCEKKSDGVFNFLQTQL